MPATCTPIACERHLTCRARAQAWLRTEVDSLLSKRPYQIFVKTPSTILLWVTASESVFSVKNKVAAKAGFPPEVQRLTYGGRQLEDDKSLSDFSVAKEATLHLALRVSTCHMPALAPAQEAQP